MLEKPDENLTILDHVVKFQYEDAKKLRMVIFFQIATIIALVLFIYTDHTNKPKPLHFYVNENNQLINPLPLNKPGISNAAISNWLSEAIMNAFGFNYKNFETKFDKLKTYFSKNGFEQFVNAFRTNPMLSGVEANKLIVSVRILEAPEILQDGIVKGKYTWNIKLPVLVTLQNELVRRGVRLDIETIVTRVPEIISPMGILIDDFAAIEFGAQPTTPTEAPAETVPGAIPGGIPAPIR